MSRFEMPYIPAPVPTKTPAKLQPPAYERPKTEEYRPEPPKYEPKEEQVMLN